MGKRSIYRVVLIAAVSVTGLAGLRAAAEAPQAISSRITGTNRDNITHTVTSGTLEKRDGRFSAQLAGKGATASVALEESGTDPYLSERHNSIRGEIRVP
jgi:plastocyanin